MPYQTMEEMPQEIRDVLPAAALKIFMAAANSAMAEKMDEGKAMATAWAAVKAAGYAKNKGGKWAKVSKSLYSGEPDWASKFQYTPLAVSALQIAKDEMEMDERQSRERDAVSIPWAQRESMMPMDRARCDQLMAEIDKRHDQERADLRKRKTDAEKQLIDYRIEGARAREMAAQPVPIVVKELDALKDHGYLPPGAVHVACAPDTREQARERAIAKGARWLVYDDGERATVYDVPHTQLDPVSKEMKRLAGSVVPPTIPTGARACFVTMRPSSVEAARRELLTGEAGVVFAKEYLAPMGLARDRVAVLATTPVFVTDADGRPQKPGDAEMVEWAKCLAKELADTKGVPVFALGGAAASFLADHASMSLPYPACIHKDGNSAKSLRAKIVRAKVLTNCQTPGRMVDNLAMSHSRGQITSSGPCGTDLLEKPIRVAKADAIEGIVGAVVLRPGIPDAERDLMTPEGVEKAAHLWMRSGGRLKYRHDRFGNRAIEGHTLETAIAKSDFMLGTEQVKAGDWYLIAQFDDAETKADIAAHKLNAFSIGGDGKRQRVRTSQ